MFQFVWKIIYMQKIAGGIFNKLLTEVDYEVTNKKYETGWFLSVYCIVSTIVFFFKPCIWLFNTKDCFLWVIIKLFMTDYETRYFKKKTAVFNESERICFLICRREYGWYYLGSDCVEKIREKMYSIWHSIE